MAAASEPLPERDGKDARDHSRDHPREWSRKRRRPARRPESDLDILGSDPFLAWLAWHGWHFHDLPTTSVAWAFTGALGTSVVAFGALGTTVCVMMLVMALAASAILMRDVTAARNSLRLVRIGLLGCILASAAHL